MADNVGRLAKLFEGFSDAYGTHGQMEKNAQKGGKMEIKKSAHTVRAPVTEELWRKHLSGEAPLGIIPIMADHTCRWGCIDVDIYDMDLGQEWARVEQQKLPLTVCRTKSGGAHVFLFLQQPLPAEAVRSRLKEIAASLGWGNSEIYPKQNQLLLDRGDLGNWLNMPYMGGDKTQRYGVKKGGFAMTLSEFLDVAESRKVSAAQLGKIKVQTEETEGLEDGPPCLQHLAAVGFPEGTRNNGLFGMAVFCKKKFGTEWKVMCERYNQMYMSPPLPAEEVTELLKNVEKGDYGYKCQDQPCVAYCNSSLCRTRKYGIGGSGEYPIISGMSKLESDPPLWFVDVEEVRLELTTVQLRDYREFHSVCMERITVCYQMMKSETWLKMVAAAMENAQIIDVPQEVSIQGQFQELLEDFLTDRHAGEKQEDLWLGKPWSNEEDGRIYFRLRDLTDHLKRQNFTSWGRNKISEYIKSIGGGTHFFNVKGKGANTWWLRADLFTPVQPVALPPSRKEPI